MYNTYTYLTRIVSFKAFWSYRQKSEFFHKIKEYILEFFEKPWFGCVLRIN